MTDLCKPVIATHAAFVSAENTLRLKSGRFHPIKTQDVCSFKCVEQPGLLQRVYRQAELCCLFMFRTQETVV